MHAALASPVSLTSAPRRAVGRAGVAVVASARMRVTAAKKAQPTVPLPAAPATAATAASTVSLLTERERKKERRSAASTTPRTKPTRKPHPNSIYPFYPPPFSGRLLVLRPARPRRGRPDPCSVPALQLVALRGRHRVCARSVLRRSDCVPKLCQP